MDAEAIVATPVETTVVTPPIDAPSLGSLSAEERLEWRKTGQLPTDKFTRAAGSPPAPAGDQPASTDATSEPASEPAYKDKTAKRMQELLTERQAATDRAERAERRAAELEARSSPAAPQAASAPAATALTEPDPEQFPYGTADPAYLKALSDYTVKAAIAAERQRMDADQQAHQTRVEGERLRQSFAAKAEAAKAKHSDFEEVALKSATAIVPGSAIDAYVWESPHGAEVLYHLQKPQHAAELRRIQALPILAQIEELAILGHRLTTDPAPAAIPITAPPPPTTLTSRGTSTDSVRAAVKRGDSRAYIDEQNAREMATRRR